MVSISVRPHRHSAEILKKNKEFVVNIPTEALLEKTDRCGVISGRDHDKFKEVGLTPAKASKVRSPLIAECPVNLECRVKQVESLGAHDVYLAEVVAAHADEDVVEGGEIQVSKARPLVFCPPTSEYWALRSKVGDYAFSAKKEDD
jgi:flavin reductase (DIM6/NTAB) family NADH-FMN oxidoreductase RutF